jgi:predicted nucleotidyltransferase
MATITTLLPCGTVRLLTHFLLDPEARLHLRALHKRTGLGMGALQRELARFESLGLIRRDEEGGRVHFIPMTERPSWTALRTLFREHADPAEVLRVALRDVEGIRAAFIFGSIARGDARPDSDIDLFVVEEGIAAGSLSRATLPAESLLGRPLDIKRYTPATLTARLKAGRAFIHDVVTGPKAWIVGSPSALSTP